MKMQPFRIMHYKLMNHNNQTVCLKGPNYRTPEAQEGAYCGQQNRALIMLSLY